MPEFIPQLAADRLVAGIDEAGRGPWAGPVVAAAVILEPEALPPEIACAIGDSKRIAKARRAELAHAIGAHARTGIGLATVVEIDRLNVLNATLLAMRRAVEALSQAPSLALVDGNRAPELPCPVRTLVAGDRLSLSIAAASIVAKVSRDEIMTALAEVHPGFGWEHNFGYGTPEHRAALKRLGVTEHHRRSFAPVRAILSLGHSYVG